MKESVDYLNTGSKVNFKCSHYMGGFKWENC